MPSSTSSSESAERLTASDRPGVAQPVPVRDIPAQPWRQIFLIAMLLSLLMTAAWEVYWRASGATPGYRNSDDSWASQRLRIDRGDGAKTVLIGSSRVLFDVQLPVWQAVTGERPIQLALEGTSSLPVMEDLADDPHFTGRLLVGVTPSLFFTGRAARVDTIAYARHQSPSQRSGQWLSQHVLEPWLAFYDADYALPALVKRWPWPYRPGIHEPAAVRKLGVQDSDRNTRMWQRLETDAEYRNILRQGWADRNAKRPSGYERPEKRAELFRVQFERAQAAITKLRRRGVRVVFLRAPSTADFYQWEQRDFPRLESWEPLLKATGVPGIHFEDYPQLQGYDSPEWSHLSASEADRFTAALLPLVLKAFIEAPVAEPDVPLSGAGSHAGYMRERTHIVMTQSY